MTQPSACPICADTNGQIFLDRHNVPVNQNVSLSTSDKALAARTGDLVLGACPSCGFIWNLAFDPSLLDYSQAYDTQNPSSRYVAHLQSLTERVLADLQDQPALIVEIGCGQGQFLKLLIENGQPCHRGIGFDTSYSGSELDSDRIRFERRYFDGSCASVHPDIVVCRHVIEHIMDPVGFLTEIRRTLGARPTRIFFETPDVEWILDNKVVWDFLYEHCSYFSASSLSSAFNKAGFSVVSVDRVFDGQYLWLSATTAAPPASASTSSNILRRAQDFGQEERNLIAQWTQKLALLNKKGPVALWGAAGKGVTMANLFDPAQRHLACLVDISPRKQNRFVGKSAHPIIGPQDLVRYGVATIIVSNPNYLDEIRNQVRQLSLTCDVVLA